MAFERFVLPGRGSTPKISINSNGQVVFNRGAFKKLGLEKFPAVVFFWDAEDKKIGIKLVESDQEDGACKLHIKGNFGVVSGSAFLNYYAIKAQVVGRHNFTFDAETKMIIMEPVKMNA